MKLFLRILTYLFSFLLLALPGCRKEKKYRIAVSQCSSDDWRTKMNEEIKREILLHPDAEVEIRSAEDQSRKQIDDIRYFAKKGFDILIVSPNEAEELTPIIKEVYEAGMPVIIFDRNINGDSYTARIGADDTGLGAAAARYALSVSNPEPKAIELYGLPGSTPAEGRHKGFTQAFTAGGGEILASIPANWNMEEAVPAVDSLLRIYPEVDIVFGHNDRMAIGASESLRKAGRMGVKTIGIDAAPEIGVKAVADSVLTATFLYPTEGHRVIRTALSILKGDPVERDVILPPSSPIDLSNADILLRQNETLEDETDKVVFLKGQIDDYWARHSSQTSLFYASIAIIFLLFFTVFLILNSFWQNKRHQKELLKQNRELEHQRDMAQELNTKLEEATQSKLMFFTNVSHDLRTPLTLIAEPVAQLAQARNLDDQQRALMRIADKNVRILKRLINQILDFRKYENDKLGLTLSEIDLGKAVEDWTESFRAHARSRRMALELVAPAHPGAVAAVDAEKIERVVFNLISNAFKYTPDGGKITVSYRSEGSDFILSVADTGGGIEERNIGNIFDRFFQVDRIHPKGSGIGLSLSKAFVEMHGGTITVESTPGKGSVFTVAIPIRHIAEKPQEFVANISEEDVNSELALIENEKTIDEAKPVVLVIDDNRDIQLLLTQLMDGAYNVLTADNGRDGLKKAEKYVPDLIICDVMMPVMDGLECLRRLKEEVRTSHIPVLMLTACSMDEQRVQGYDNGADGYLSKPFNSDVLLSRSAALIANRKRIKDLWQKEKGATTSEKAGDSQRKSLPKSDIDNDFYNRFLDVFAAEMGNSEVSVDDIASKLGFERTQFYRKIKAITNYSPVELMRRIRLKEGRRLLKQSDRTISEIAYETGFSTPAYFTKCYRDAFGETPSETRRR